MGVPDVQSFWADLVSRDATGNLNGDELKLLKKLTKALVLIESNPRHNSLQSHEIEPLTRRAGFKVFQSYLENKTPSAGRIFWAYGPDKGEITILAIHPHPEDKKSHGYQEVRLSEMP